MSMEKVCLDDVLHVPEFTSSFLSVSRLCDDGSTVVFDAGKVLVKKAGKIIRRGQREENIYVTPLMHVETARPIKTAKTTALDLWHLRLGHTDRNYISRMANLRDV